MLTFEKQDKSKQKYEMKRRKKNALKLVLNEMKMKLYNFVAISLCVTVFAAALFA
jgi:hypothetical protein